MALVWDWKNKMGKVIYKNGVEDMLYKGNCLTVAIREFEDNTYQLNWFACDKGHFKRMLGLEKGTENIMKDWGIKKIELDLNYEGSKDMVNLMTKAEMEITFELYKQ